jgi:hypothetical protein
LILLVARARFTIDKLLQASAAGFLDGDLELSKAYKYLGTIYAESSSSRNAILNEEAL